MKQNEEEMMKKKKVQECCWATAHFQFALGHDTIICIMAQGWGGWPRRASGAHMVSHDTAGWAMIQPTTRPREATTWPEAPAHAGPGWG